MSAVTDEVVATASCATAWVIPVAEVKRILEAAAPLIAAAERERIRDLANELHAIYVAVVGSPVARTVLLQFADLLEGGSES